ncbi:Putative uncharacterized protein [Mycoavidus cysteinexigens]|uniref:Uncharacterized protein n=1 Tax=Mycoavidus cysteinexigens TaxID=1553431 RepID=A0A2Z6ETK7_9BURK|nr:hypothetical protein [Mycoavidus cysteinexigens]BBE08763.1 Putative uncharacterized protein [Mycoavidus cysteinexigens]GAM52523.1 hypothetical protein EBME_0986 [bacterium endosymbiont of Mortierella elongata FMR23-6]GLR01585.1 hypothetical protein GCM10007934_13970 [Mycoavidus cysteinexigens]
MLLLKTGTRGIPRRTTGDTLHDEDQPDAQHCFEALLHAPVSHACAPQDAASDPPASAPPYPLHKSAEAHFVATARSLRKNLETLHLRLTNGPLAGLEISACAHGPQVALSVQVPDKQQFERAVGQLEECQAELARLFDHSVTLEVRDATPATD